MIIHTLKIRAHKSAISWQFEDVIEKLYGEASNFAEQHNGATTNWSHSGDTAEIRLETTGECPTLKELKEHLEPFFAYYDSRHFPCIEYPVCGETTRKKVVGAPTHSRAAHDLRNRKGPRIMDR